MLYVKRKYFKNLSKDLGRIFSKLYLSPNQWTVMSLLLAIVLFYFISSKNFLAAFVLCIATISIDMIDGAVARATNRATKFGAYLDTVTDRFIEFLIIFGFLFVGYPSFVLSSEAWIMLLIFGSFISTYSKSAAFEKGLVAREMKGGGILEHTDRLILFLLVILTSQLSLIYAVYLIAIAAVLTYVSFLQRFLIVTKNHR